MSDLTDLPPLELSPPAPVPAAEIPAEAEAPAAENPPAGETPREVADLPLVEFPDFVPRPGEGAPAALVPRSGFAGDILDRYESKALVRARVYFAFRYDDVLRANNVRQVEGTGFAQQLNPRDAWDYTIWRHRESYDPQSVKDAIGEAVAQSAVVCVLVGTDTWDSRWVKYEIARAVIDGKGLFSVGINNLKHPYRRETDLAGLNPLLLMGIRHGPDGKFYLYEHCLSSTAAAPSRYLWQWQPYTDHTAPVRLPPYLAAPPRGCVEPLVTGARHYDYVMSDGRANLGRWLDFAAAQVGH